MNENIKNALLTLAGAMAGLALVLAVTVVSLTPDLTPNSLPPCATEDSDNCYWDAQTQGNGVGQDSVVITGEAR